MGAPEANTGNFNSARQQGLFAELLWVHGLLRRDLATVRQLANSVRAGATPEHVTSTIDQLETEGPLWKLKANCLYYCRFVHGHHTLEDTHLFPAIRRADPALDEVVDRLESDHLGIAATIEEIRNVVRDLDSSDSDDARVTLIQLLDGLSDSLLEHLDFEEENLEQVMTSMTMEEITSS